MPRAILTDINNKCQIEFPVDTGKRMTVYFIYVNGGVQPSHQTNRSVHHNPISIIVFVKQKLFTNLKSSNLA